MTQFHLKTFISRMNEKNTHKLGQHLNANRKRSLTGKSTIAKSTEVLTILKTSTLNMRLSLKIGEALSETFQLKCCLRWNEGQQHYSNQICLPFNAFANATLRCHCPLSANNNKLPFSALVFFLLFLLLLMLVKIKSKRASDAHDSRTQTKYTPSKRFGKSCSKFAFVQKWANDWRHYRKAMLQLTENSLLDTFFFWYVSQSQSMNFSSLQHSFRPIVCSCAFF